LVDVVYVTTILALLNSEAYVFEVAVLKRPPVEDWTAGVPEDPWAPPVKINGVLKEGMNGVYEEEEAVL